AQVEMIGQGGSVGRVVIHVVPIAHLRGPAVAASVVRDDTEALAEEVEHLGVPVIGAQRPSVMEDDRLRIPRAPILVEDFDAFVRGQHAHGYSSRCRVERKRVWLLASHGRTSGTSANAGSMTQV